LWKDLQGIELLLGGGEIVQSQWNNQVSTKYKKYDQLSQAGAQLLCCAMTDEITAYINILNKAVNLNMEARSHSFAYLLRRCGVESFQKLEETCSPLSFRFLF
jgi:dissimilatory sulfite reductase (desulfoviridin) alpha/beta subunit